MTTTLYIVTLAAWHVFLTFRDEDQIVRCEKMKDHVEFVFNVNAACLSITDEILLLDEQIFQRKKA